MLISIAYIQVQVCATNGIWKQFGETKIKQRHFHEYRSNQEQTGATRIIFIHLYAFKYKYVQPMACRHNKVHPDRIVDTFSNIQVQVCADKCIQKQLGADRGNQYNFHTFICIQVQVCITNGMLTQSSATRCKQNNMYTISYIQVQVCTTNGKQKQLCATRCNKRLVDAFSIILGQVCANSGIQKQLG